MANLLQNRLKILVCISVLLVLTWMVIIYKFSSANGEKSDHTSSSTLEYIIRLFNRNIENARIEELTTNYNVYIRKFAHFSVYLIGGILILFMYNNINKLTIGKLKYIRLISIITGVIYSISDEMHQYFVPGRSCEIKDMGIDSLGIIIGVFVCYAIIYKFSSAKLNSSK